MAAVQADAVEPPLEQDTGCGHRGANIVIGYAVTFPEKTLGEMAAVSSSVKDSRSIQPEP
ncbi:hypothetical protein [Rhizobium changzhiense]|uniref:Uncharacterized protein n=1 Tax=Rhizobium changzhiense TaxID=2692317 RepID=A0ABR6A667_9HYPH|nr:hypothetical protein [Rhizobium changzhiense]MBA5802126.1 hypothetical protein [Rhizobium changzhiense]NNU47115.1 hypothetical protein [Rhizobium changzhiense]